MTEFVGFRKIPRLSREMIVTEKIDGTNASICITEDGQFLIGSRTRWITPADDNYGFARWATEHKDELMTLGVGHHFGEWWGGGIQRKYGLDKDDKRWSLFNVSRWCLYGSEPQIISGPDPRITKYQDVLPACVGLVPALYRGIFDTREIEDYLSLLKTTGSFAAPGFMKPEGIVIYHVQGNIFFKKTIEKDEESKGAL